jgi:[acyl-carrier-protein] S-malonyltransferase
MAAVLRADPKTVEKICKEVEGVVEPVNYNGPGQIVIAGAARAVEVASAALREAGARTMPLPVSAPFHSSLMRPAEERLRSDLEGVTMSEPKVPIYTNVSAKPVTKARDARDALIRQVSRPVLWEQSVEKMVADGVTLFVEIGPGKVLTGLISRIAKDVARVNVEGPDDLEPARQAITDHAG